MIQEEVQEQDLLGGDNSNVESDQQDAENNEMQLGFVEIFQPPQDLIFSSKNLMHPQLLFKLNPEAVRQWASYFSAPG